jgi:hypothetical protein
VDGFAAGDASNALDLLLNGFEVLTPNCYDFLHWWGRGGEAVLFAVGMENCVILGEECILGHDLGGEKMG